MVHLGATSQAGRSALTTFRFPAPAAEHQMHRRPAINADEAGVALRVGEGMEYDEELEEGRMGVAGSVAHETMLWERGTSTTCLNTHAPYSQSGYHRKAESSSVRGGSGSGRGSGGAGGSGSGSGGGSGGVRIAQVSSGVGGSGGGNGNTNGNNTNGNNTNNNDNGNNENHVSSHLHPYVRSFNSAKTMADYLIYI
jgi:hypothetical protein